MMPCRAGQGQLMHSACRARSCHCQKIFPFGPGRPQAKMQDRKTQDAWNSFNCCFVSLHFPPLRRGTPDLVLTSMPFTLLCPVHSCPICAAATVPIGPTSPSMSSKQWCVCTLPRCPRLPSQWALGGLSHAAQTLTREIWTTTNAPGSPDATLPHQQSPFPCV